jgi:starvation-inducible DNA-binding protein
MSVDLAQATACGLQRTWEVMAWPHERGREIQQYGTVSRLPIGLGQDVRAYISERLNRILADSQILHALYKKHHWQMHDPTFASLHALLGQHADEQAALIDRLAERVQTLGGVAVGDLRHVAELTGVPRAPNGVEPVAAMLSRLLEAHAIVLGETRGAARRISARRDQVTYDLLVSGVLRTGERQARALGEHLADIPRAGQGANR